MTEPLKMAVRCYECCGRGWVRDGDHSAECRRCEGWTTEPTMLPADEAARTKARQDLIAGRAVQPPS